MLIYMKNRGFLFCSFIVFIQPKSLSHLNCVGMHKKQKVDYTQTASLTLYQFTAP